MAGVIKKALRQLDFVEQSWKDLVDRRAGRSLQSRMSSTW